MVVVVHVLELCRFVPAVDLVYVRLRLGVVQDCEFLMLRPLWILCVCEKNVGFFVRLVVGTCTVAVLFLVS